jgi:pimeloyl-ACP methyl ester carboxylesterase
LHRRLAFLLVLVVALGAAGCAAGDAHRVEKGSTPTPSGNEQGSAGAPRIAWRECGNADCGTMRVPLSPGHPALGTIDLALARHRATGKRIGTLLTNPGGPGAAALWMAQQATDFFPDAVLQHFDVVSWDPRGVGRSAAVECADNLDFFWSQDHSPDNAREVASNVSAAKRLARDCETKSGRILPYVSSRQTVHDMELIRRALGENKISYLGFSYGTYLGALYADTYPQHVRAMVLDGAVDPAQSSEAASNQQAIGFEKALDAFLVDCSHDTNCDFYAGGNPQRGYDRLMVSIDAEPVFARVDGEERTLGPGEADVGVAEALYGGKKSWPKLAAALGAAARGDGSKLLQLSDEYTERSKGGTYSNLTDAFYAIGCLDGTAPRSAAAIARQANAIAARAPHFGATTTWLALPCVYWPAKPDGVAAPVHARGAPPILVLGTTHDPATPFASARSLAKELDSGHLVALNDEGHAAYGRNNKCIDGIVHRYLLDLTVPRDGTSC